MTDNNPIIYENLPKEEQKALRKSFDKKGGSTKVVIIATIIMAASFAVGVFIGLLSDSNRGFFFATPFPVLLVVIFSQNEEKFNKWLEGEKGIMRKAAVKKQERKANKAK